MVGFSEAQKVSAINKVFADSYKSPLSIIVVDNLERLIGKDYLFRSSMMSFMLLTLLANPCPQILKGSFPTVGYLRMR